ncbi:multidrug transporter [Citricoccus zhacaiensis]|uniref:Multidrug transporter n=1 Tax=Citricoccus zhacaiensis TaxID=489142 RepID=A0ABQ2LSC2_9MICC|nr:GRP family sugar transporter [Citricoccus zhacaiensis]GGO42589.1 multidrug transporter [Citricoccus zhacaiensis]
MLALASAVVYGLVDYAGGILSRRLHYAFVAWVGQVGGLLFALLAAIAVPTEHVGLIDLGFGALSGVGSAVTMLYLNRALARGDMSVVLPISAVTGVALSVLCGVWFLAEQPAPAAWVGIGVMLPALWLVSSGRRRHHGSSAIRDGLIASVGVAVQYIGLGLATDGSGLWAVVAGRAAAVLVLAPVFTTARNAWPVSWADTAKALTIGAGAALGLSLYLLATRQQLLAIAVALASLYPVIPVLLGVFVLREHVTHRRIIGLVAAGVAVVLLSLG